MVEKGAIPILVDGLGRSNDLHRAACQSLLRIADNNDEARHEIYDAGGYIKVADFIGELGASHLPLVKLSLDLVEQMSQSDDLHEPMANDNVLALAARTATLFKGNFVLLRLCMMIMVRTLTTLESDATLTHLMFLLNADIISTVTYCLKSSNNELMFWTIGLLHEYVVKDLAIDEFSRVRGLPKILVDFMDTLNENSVLRIIFRIVRYLSRDNVDFQRELVGCGFISKVLTKFRKSDPDTQYWIGSILHTLTLKEEFHEEFLKEETVKVILKVASKAKRPVAFLLCEIIVMLSDASDRSTKILFDADVLNIAYRFLRSSERELNYGGVMIIFDCLKHSSEDRFKLFYEYDSLKLLGNTMLKAYKLGEDDTFPPVLAAKTLVAMRTRNPSCELEWARAVLQPLLHDIMDISTNSVIPSTEQLTMLKFHLHCLSYFASPAAGIITPRTVAVVEWWELSITALFSLAHWLLEASRGAADQFDDVIKSLSIKFPMARFQLDFDDDLIDIGLFAVQSLCGFLGSDGSREWLFEHGLMHLLAELVMIDHDRISYETLKHFASLFLHEKLRENLVKYIYDEMPSSYMYRFISAAMRARVKDQFLLAEMFVSQLSKLLPSGFIPSNVRMDYESKTPNLLMASNGLVVQNHEWTFDSARATVGVKAQGRFAFEIEIYTVSENAVIQVGWMNSKARFEPDGGAGAGVGDDENSYAFDGTRKKKWHGDRICSQSYGEAWKVGDIVTCLLDLNVREISFAVNGVSMGVAFSGINSLETWYPAVTLSGGQVCRIAFGGMFDPFRMPLPHGYLGISALGKPVDVIIDKDYLIRNYDPERIPVLDEAGVPDSVSDATGLKLRELRLHSPQMYFEVQFQGKLNADVFAFGVSMSNGETIIFAITESERNVIVHSQAPPPKGLARQDFYKAILVNHSPSPFDDFFWDSSKVRRHDATPVSILWGDWIGCAYVENRICFLHNSRIIGIVHLDENSEQEWRNRCVTPLIHSTQINVNFGAFKFRNSLMDHQTTYDSMLRYYTFQSRRPIAP